MIVGDKIVVSNLVVDGSLVAVTVTTIEKHEIAWRYEVPMTAQSLHADRVTLNFDSTISGHVSKRDRGLTWAPAWIESEVDLLRVVEALRTLDTLPPVS